MKQENGELREPKSLKAPDYCHYIVATGLEGICFGTEVPVFVSGQENEGEDLVQKIEAPLEITEAKREYDDSKYPKDYQLVNRIVQYNDSSVKQKSNEKNQRDYMDAVDTLLERYEPLINKIVDECKHIISTSGTKISSALREDLQADVRYWAWYGLRDIDHRSSVASRIRLTTKNVWKDINKRYNAGITQLPMDIEKRKKIKKIQLDDKEGDGDDEDSRNVRLRFVDNGETYQGITSFEEASKIVVGLFDLVKRDRDAKIVWRRYGFDGEGGYTLQEIADELGLSTRERVRQLESRAIKDMREGMSPKDFAYLSDFVEEIDAGKICRPNIIGDVSREEDLFRAYFSELFKDEEESID